MPSRLHLLFEKYLKRQCSPAEVDELIVLLQQAEAEDKLSGPMQQLWESLRKDDIQYEVDWDKMYHAVVSSEEQADKIINRSTSKKLRKWYFMAAAVFLLAFAVVFFRVYYQQPQPGTAENLPPVPAIKNKSGSSHQTIHLPDGSTVILNTGSTLNYPSAFREERRDVYLTGEGFFDIKHNSSQPFYVHAGKLVIKVLGTAFNVKSYPQQQNIQVTVSRGKVQVLKENKTLGILTASQQISFVNKSEDAVITTADTLAVTAWKPAEIFFDDITMAEAADRIKERFNTTIEFKNPAIRECRVTATFSEEDLLEEMIAVICAVTKAEYTITDAKIIIDGKGCN